jgi:hypothetical protein
VVAISNHCTTKYARRTRLLNSVASGTTFCAGAAAAAVATVAAAGASLARGADAAAGFGTVLAVTGVAITGVAVAALTVTGGTVTGLAAVTVLTVSAAAGTVHCFLAGAAAALEPVVYDALAPDYQFHCTTNTMSQKKHTE